MSGTLVTLSGIDGSGKSTVAKQLVTELENSGYSASYQYGRYTAKVAKPIMAAGEWYLQSDSDGEYQQYAENKSNLLEANITEKVYEATVMTDYLPFLFLSIKMKLLSHDYVICDRYFYDTILKNFGSGTVEDGETAVSLVEKYSRFVPTPDHSFFLTVPVEVAIDRKDDIPSIEYIEHQNKLYEEFVDEANANTLDGRSDVETIVTCILEDLNTYE